MNPEKEQIKRELKILMFVLYGLYYLVGLFTGISLMLAISSIIFILAI